MADEQFLTPLERETPLPVGKGSFNHHLSLMRQAIELRFGLLVRRWGILAHNLGVAASTRPLIVDACAGLHNFCVDVRLPPTSDDDIRQLFGCSSCANRPSWIEHWRVASESCASSRSASLDLERVSMGCEFMVSALGVGRNGVDGCSGQSCGDVHLSVVQLQLELPSFRKRTRPPSANPPHLPSGTMAEPRRRITAYEKDMGNKGLTAHILGLATALTPRQLRSDQTEDRSPGTVRKRQR